MIISRIVMQVLVAMLLLVVQGCSSSSSNIEDYPRYTDTLSKRTNKVPKKYNQIPNYSRLRRQVAPGYRYSLYHPSDKKLQGRFRSDFKGILRLPYGVVISTKGKSFSDVKKLVLKAYHKFFQKGVEGVSFRVLASTRWVEVRGLVKKPGRFLIKSDTALDSVIAKASGVNGDITKEYFSATINQRNRSYSVILNEFFENSNMSKKITWLGGDTVFIKKVDMLSEDSQRVPFVTILGGVAKPGKTLYQKDANLYYFIEKSGGLITGLGYNECYIFRQVNGSLKKINFDFTKPETIPVIFAGDTIYMNSQVVTVVDKWLQRMSHVTAMISTVALLILAL